MSELAKKNVFFMGPVCFVAAWMVAALKKLFMTPDLEFYCVTHFPDTNYN